MKMVDGELASTGTELKGLIQGKCQEFCSLSEQRLRKREKLVHKLEQYEKGYQLVKQYSRPAAGQKGPNGKEVRSPETLVKCVRYLMSTVLRKEMSQCNQLDLYDFLFDRLRAIRQDLVLQSSSSSVQLFILAVCVRFHLLFGLLLNKDPNFFHHINSQHQLDCLKSCLLIPEDHLTPAEEEDLQQMKCLYLLSNLNSPHAMTWAVNQTFSSHGNSLGTCFKIALSYQEGNFVRFFRMVSIQPILLLIATSKYCHLMYDHAIKVCKVAYKSPNLKYPVDHLSKLLWIGCPSQLEYDLKARGFKVEKGNVWFGINTPVENFDSIDCYNRRLRQQLYCDLDNVERIILKSL